MNAAELALMGLLMESPNYPYQLEQVIATRNMREWTEIGFSSIYYLLNKLEGEGLVQLVEETEQGAGPARKVYQLTPEGRKAWRRAHMEALRRPPEPRSAFLLALSQVPAQREGEVLTALKQRLENLEERRRHLDHRWQQAGRGQYLYLDALFEWPLALLEAEQAWLMAFIARLTAAATNAASGNRRGG